MLSEVLFARSSVALLALAALSAVGSAATETVRGRLASPGGSEPLRLVGLNGASIELVVDESLERTMRDPQLATRLWELRGQVRRDGRLAVERIFTVIDGQLHRVTYYCVICHITTHEPGRCMCCQGDTDLREIPGE